MIVVDASVLIAYLDDHDAHHEDARALIAIPDDFGVHTINLAETLVHGALSGQVDDMAAEIAAVEIHELDRLPTEARLLAELRSGTRLKLPDCCVIAVSQAHAARLATFDSRLATVARARGMEVLGAGR